MARFKPTLDEFDYAAAESRNGGPVIHKCPPRGSNVMPCCGEAPNAVPRWHRMTLDDDLVNCSTDG